MKKTKSYGTVKKNDPFGFGFIISLVIFVIVVFGGLSYLTKDMKRYSSHQNKINDYYEMERQKVWESKSTYIIIETEYPRILEEIVSYSAIVGFKPVGSVTIRKGTYGDTFFQALQRDKVPKMGPYVNYYSDKLKN